MHLAFVEFVGESVRRDNVLPTYLSPNRVEGTSRCLPPGPVLHVVHVHLSLVFFLFRCFFFSFPVLEHRVRLNFFSCSRFQLWCFSLLCHCPVSAFPWRLLTFSPPGYVYLETTVSFVRESLDINVRQSINHFVQVCNQSSNKPNNGQHSTVGPVIFSEFASFLIVTTYSGCALISTISFSILFSTFPFGANAFP